MIKELKEMGVKLEESLESDDIHGEIEVIVKELQELISDLEERESSKMSSIKVRELFRERVIQMWRLELNKVQDLLDLGLVDEARSRLALIHIPGATRSTRLFVSKKLRQYYKSLKKEVENINNRN